MTIQLSVPRTSLPPSAEEQVAGGSSAGGNPNQAQPTPCPPDNFWNGNVDVFWNGTGGSGQVFAHFGTVLVCPGGGPSYIHVLMDCPDPGGITWSFSGLCPGFSADLVPDAGGMPGAASAPNPIPAGFFDGWICITADPSVPTGAVCYIDLNVTCAGVTEVVTVCVEACDWGVVPVEAMSWGELKTRFGSAQ